MAKLHLEAIQKAHGIQRNAPAALGRRRCCIDCAGGHFLTDCFRFRHPFNTGRTRSSDNQLYQNNPPRPANPEMRVTLFERGCSVSCRNCGLKYPRYRLNTEGIEVANKKGMKWRHLCDDRLRMPRKRFVLVLWHISFASTNHAVTAEKFTLTRTI